MSQEITSSSWNFRLEDLSKTNFVSDKKDFTVLNIDIDREVFVRKTAIEILRSLEADKQPLWGIMSTQHMVEHLIYITGNILDDREIKLITPEEKLPRYKQFLMSPYGFVRNFKFPLLPENETTPLEFENMDAAIEAFESITERLFGYIDNIEFRTSLHPMYGYLNRDERIMFQFKHIQHHLMQFELI